MSRCLTSMLTDVQVVLICCKMRTFLFSLWHGSIKKEMGCLANIRPQLEKYSFDTVSLISKAAMILQSKT